jgi:two-component system, LytTR family, response regulator
MKAKKGFLMAEVGPKKWRAVVADDEPFARERVRRLLADETEVELVGEASDGIEAIAAVRALAPDLLFLDVQMPGKDGFQVLEALTPAETPVVVFLTAYDQYAVRAFEAAALDYVLKPFDEERFKKAVTRACAQAAQVHNKQPAGLAQASAVAEGAVLKDGTHYLDRLLIRTGGRVLFRRTDEIDWIEAEGNYVRLHAGSDGYLMREPLSSLEAKLDPTQFTRIHRSILVQIARIREIRPQLNGQSTVVLENGTHLTLSRRYRRHLPRIML